MNKKRWLSLLCAAAILCMSFGALAEGDVNPPADPPPATAVPTPKPTEVPTPKPTDVPKPTDAPTPAPTDVPKPTDAPTQEPPKPTDVPQPTEVPQSTDAPTQAPTEAPKPTDAPTPTLPPTDAPTQAPTAAPTGAPTQEPTQEPTAEPTEAPTPEPTEQPTPNPEVLAINGLSADRATASVGQAVRFSYKLVGASGVEWRVQRSDGGAQESGQAGAEGFSWTPAQSGVYTMKVTAAAGGETAVANTVITVTAGALQAKVDLGVRYAMIGERALRYKLSVSGGVEPYAVSIVIEANGKTVYTTDAFSNLVMLKPRVFADHTLILTVTDAAGASASDKATIRVSTNKTNMPPVVPKLRRDLNYADRLLAVARSQVGYKESDENFIIEEGGKKQSWSFYGSEYGMPYEEWCAMFVSYCLKMAGVPEWTMPRSANCYRWRLALGSRYVDDEDEYIPEPGDLIFFHHERDGENPDPNFPNHIGIVREYSERWNTVYTVEGNVGGKVVEKAYALEDETIVGYTSMRYAMERWDPNYLAEVPLDVVEGLGLSVAAPRLEAQQDD